MRSGAQRVVALSVVLAAAQQCHSAAAPAAPKGRSASAKCGEEKPWRGRRPWVPPAGVTLLAGVKTGMRREEVARIDQRLLRPLASGSFELVPGFPMRGQVVMGGDPELVTGFRLHAVKGYSTLLEALRTRYGPERVLEVGTRFVEMPRGYPGATISPEEVRLAWCDQGRTIILSGQRRDFWVEIEPTPS